MRTFYAPEIQHGEVLGDYSVLEPLGRGPVGTTYHAMHKSSGKEFVLKTVMLSELIPMEWIERFEAQATLIGKLRSAAVDPVLATGRYGPFLYAIKDFVHDGEGASCDLRQYIARHGGKLSSFQTFNIVKQMVTGLLDASRYQDAHHHGILHGNLKPENVLIGHCKSVGPVPFEVKMTDWEPYALYQSFIVGEAFRQWNDRLGDKPGPMRERALGNALHAIYRRFDYLAPELRQQRRPTVQGDIFSLGMLTYEMLTGDVPSGTLRKPSEICPELPSGWDKFCNMCVQHRADLRFQHYEAMLEYVEVHLASVEQDQMAAEQKPAAQPVKRERRSLTPPGMVFIPAATFLVGSADCGEDCLPVHECRTKGFYMDRTLVTNAQFERFILETGYETEAEQGEGGPVWLDGEWTVVPGVSWRQPFGKEVPREFMQHPVVQITYNDCLAYADWCGRRLPTEEEWEYAARGGLKEVRYPWGNTISRTQANFASDSTVPVMQYPANGFGLYDMAGNVWEWTNSWYKAYPGNSRNNPHFGDKYKVVRGGAWMNDGAHCMVAFRNANVPTHCLPTVGFRTAADFEQQS